MKYTDAEIQIIREQYSLIGKKIVSLLPNRTYYSIQNRAKRLGIKVVTAEYDYHIQRDDAIALAMLIDCEGTIGIWKRSDRLCSYNPQIAIYNTNRFLIEWAKSVIHLPHRIHVDNRSVFSHKIAYNLAVRGIGPTYSLLKEIIPFLKIKKELGELLFEYDLNRIGKPIRQINSAHDHEIYNKLRELNRKGQ